MNPSNKIRVIDPESPDPYILEEAAEVIRCGGIVVFPTRCLYGLAADALNHEAVSGIFRIKTRPSVKPILVLIKNEESLSLIVKEVTPQARLLMKQFWPGRLTIIFPAHQNLSTILTANTGKIGVRLPGHPVARALVYLSDNPITGTSANLSGQPGVADIRKLDSTIIQMVDLILDAGPLLGGAGSTVVDATEEKCRIVREGIISSEKVLEALKQT